MLYQKSILRMLKPSSADDTCFATNSEYCPKNLQKWKSEGLQAVKLTISCAADEPVHPCDSDLALSSRSHSIFLKKVGIDHYRSSKLNIIVRKMRETWLIRQRSIECIARVQSSCPTGQEKFKNRVWIAIVQKFHSIIFDSFTSSNR